MKTLLNKINPLAILTLVLGLGLMSGSFAQRAAIAGPTDVTPGIQITNLQAFAGQYVQVIYAVGAPALLSLETPVPTIYEVRPQSQAQQITANVQNFAPVEIAKTPGRGSYNMIVIVISPTPNIVWYNPNVNSNPPYRFMRVILKTEISTDPIVINL